MVLYGFLSLVYRSTCSWVLRAPDQFCKTQGQVISAKSAMLTGNTRGRKFAKPTALFIVPQPFWSPVIDF